MPDDLAQVPLDQPTVERAPATSGSARGIRTPRSRLRDRSRPSGLIGWLLIAIAGLGMLVSTPPSAGPDEPQQNVTAWYLSGHGLRPSSIEWFSVPVSFATEPCFAHKSDVSASCMPSRTTGEAMASTSWVLTYPPPYYWVVGIGQRIAAALVGIEYADVGGRLASFVLNFGALLLLSLYMRRRDPWWGTFLLLVSTPMAVFLGVVVNPSGWEITCGLVMAAVLSGTVWSRQPLGSGAWPKTSTVILALASVALSLARPIGFFWASGLTVSAIALAPSMNRRLLLRVASAVAPGIVLGMLWYLTNPNVAAATTAMASKAAATGVDTSLAASFVYFPLRLFQMFGVLGWLDTPMPDVLFLVLLAGWAVLLRRMPSIGRAAILCGIFGIVIAPSLIEATVSGGWPNWWQGRYTMPFAVGFVLLLLLRSGWLVPRTISIMSGIALLSLGVMVWVNAVRYDFGLGASDLPLSLAHPGLSPIRLVLSAAIGALLVLVSEYLLVKAWRMERDPRPRPEPEMLSTDSEPNAS
jgi:Predicted membrane protein (DUF2142)